MTAFAEAPRQSQTEGYRVRAYDAVRIALGLLLLTAAGLKGYALATGPVAEDGLMTSRWFSIMVVEGELLLGLWLLSGLWRQLAWWAAVVCFSTFASVALYQALSGFESCGCFGKLELNPWYTFGLDMVATTALLAFPPNGGPAAPRLMLARFVAVVILMLVIGLPGGMAMALYSPPTLDGDTLLPEEGGTVVLHLESWINQPFPLRNHIDVGQRLAEGQWVVILYKHTCPACRQALPRYERIAQEWSEQPGAPQVALIEVPPYASSDDDPVSPDTVALRGRLSDQYDWRVRVPASLDIQGGTVAATPSDRLSGQ